MASQNSPPHGAEPDRAASSEPAARPKRSPVERAIVWGGIGILAIVVGIEGTAHLAFTGALNGLMAEMEKAENAEKGNYHVTKATVDAVLKGRAPDRSKTVKRALGEERYDLYIFKGLLKERTLSLHYGVQGVLGEPEVLEVSQAVPAELL